MLESPPFCTDFRSDDVLFHMRDVTYDESDRDKVTGGSGKKGLTPQTHCQSTTAATPKIRLGNDNCTTLYLCVSQLLKTFEVSRRPNKTHNPKWIITPSVTVQTERKLCKECNIDLKRNSVTLSKQKSNYFVTFYHYLLNEQWFFACIGHF